MNKLDKWDIFYNSGTIADYIKYAQSKNSNTKFSSSKERSSHGDFNQGSSG